MTDTLVSILFDLAIKSSVVLGAAWLITALMRRSSAAERHTIWLMALAGTLALPLILALGPRLEMPVPATAALESVAAVLERQFSAESSVITPIPFVTEGDSTAASVDAAASFTSQPNAPANRFTFAQALLAIYLLSVAALALRYASMRLRVTRHVGSLEPFDDDDLQRRSDAVRRTLGIRRKVRLVRSDHDHSPWAWGIARPRIVLPAEFSSWSTGQQHHALMHELAHVRRNDHVAGILAQLCCTLYWFNPLVWVGVRRLLLDAERAADDRVIAAGGCAHLYAEQLLQIANQVFSNKSRSVWIPAMAHRSNLSPRVHSILDPNKRRSAMSKSRMSLVAFAAMAFVLPLATLQSQQPILDINDAEFQLLVANGPAGSGELERIVDTYVESGMDAAAADAVARFVLGEYGTADEEDCNFCIEVFSSEATPHQHRHFPVMLAAFDLIEQRAELQRSGDPMLQATLSNIVASGNAHAMNRATYFVMRSLQIGIEEQQSLSVTQFLYEQGSIAAARDLAAWLFEDEASLHYQSEAAQQWIAFLDSEARRRDTVARMIIQSLGVGGDASDGDYLPVVKVAPVYPAEAAEKLIEGSVVVEFTVNTDGKPENVLVVSSTDALFNDSAVAAAQKFRYAPRIVAGTPVSVPGVRNKITYRLDQ